MRVSIRQHGLCHECSMAEWDHHEPLSFFCFSSNVLIFTNPACMSNAHQNCAILDWKWIPLWLTLLQTHERWRSQVGERWPVLTNWCAVLSYPLPQCLVAHLLSSTENRSVPVLSWGNESHHTSLLWLSFLLSLNSPACILQLFICLHIKHIRSAASQQVPLSLDSRAENKIQGNEPERNGGGNL